MTDLQQLKYGCNAFSSACWLALVGREPDAKVPPHFEDVKHVFAFADRSMKIPESDGYRFGHYSYELKNRLENLSSKNPSRFTIEREDFFRPNFIVLVKRNGTIHFEVGDPSDFENFIRKQEVQSFPSFNVQLRPTLSRSEYVKTISSIQKHIQLGDVYELNFCMDHTADNVKIDPVNTFAHLMENSEAPFSVFYKRDNINVISLSPERSMAKRGDCLYSQPMKGTQKRNMDVPVSNLKTDIKERSENVMITDLVRNDLSKSAEKGSVEIDELCGVYPYGSVWQMISTVSCRMKNDVQPEKALLDAFPMGSMTGAPKVKAMELIDQYEDFQRGIYSGSIGYFAPNGDFDFNVVIRSLIYDSENHRLSCPTGSAITILSDPNKEYDECLLKAAWIKEELESA